MTTEKKNKIFIQLKVSAVGKISVGKSSFITKLIKDTYSDITISTIGVDFSILKKNQYKYTIWDTAGQENFNSLTSMHTQGVNMLMICLDIFGMVQTEKNITDTINFFTSAVDETKVRVAILLCKSDLKTDRHAQIIQYIKELAIEKEYYFFMCSAKIETRKELQDKFFGFCDYYQKHNNVLINNNRQSITLTNDDNSSKQHKKSQCC